MVSIADLRARLKKAQAKFDKATRGLKIAERRVNHFKARARRFHKEGNPSDEHRASAYMRKWQKRQAWWYSKKQFLVDLVTRRKAKVRKWAREHKHVYGAGGWASTSTWWIQRVDQGQDFEVPFGERVRAPGDGTVIGHGQDNPFPYGFGHHLIVHIDNGPFGGRDYYIGHVEGLVDNFPVGHRFKKGDLLSQTNHGLNAGRGWVELGTYPYGSMGTGWNIHSLFHDITE
jgi:murein DD-endopeptidase MepM/ murein hydrolase activator NlpD